MTKKKSNRNISITESSSVFENLDSMSIQDLISNINQEDALVHRAVKKALPQIKSLIEQILVKMHQGGRIFYLGAGTSGRLGVLDASEIPPTFGVSEDRVIGIIAGGEKALRKSVEAAEDDKEQAWIELQKHQISELDTVIGIAASGTTPYVIGGVTLARKNGHLTGCITCNPNSEIAKVVEYPIEVIVGPEIITGSTRLKAGTAQKMVLNMITTTLMIKMGYIKGNKMIYMQLANQKLVERGTRMIMEEINISYEKAKNLLLKYGSVNEALKHFETK